MENQYTKFEFIKVIYHGRFRQTFPPAFKEKSSKRAGDKLNHHVDLVDLFDYDKATQ